jgi:hypothetical protein
MAEEFPTSLDFPHISEPPVDYKNGLWTPRWYEIMRRLIERTGGVDGDLVNQNTTDITGKADKTIQIIAGLGLDGGGTLAADITIDVDIDEALDIVGSTVGAILVRGVAGWQILIPGDVGEVLTSNGAGMVPSYQENAGACLPLVQAPTGIAITNEACGTVFTNEM